LLCHDAEDPEGLEHLGDTAEGHPADVSRHVTESDLSVYVNASTTRGFSGGWKSVCVGLSSYRSIRSHHDPDTMSMSIDRNRMHEILDEMGRVVTHRLGANRIFKIETLLANPLQVHRIVAGDVDACRRVVLDVTRAHQPARPEAPSVVPRGLGPGAGGDARSVRSPGAVRAGTRGTRGLHREVPDRLRVPPDPSGDGAVPVEAIAPRRAGDRRGGGVTGR